jgi:hypothetical protein
MRMTMQVRSHIASQELAEVPSTLDHRVLASVRQEVAAVRGKKRWFEPVWFTRISIPLPAAASIVFLLIVGSLLFSPLIFQEESPQPETRIEQTLPLPPELHKALQLYK